MPRTTPELVAQVTEVDPDIDLTIFITTANAIVNQVCLESGYTEDYLTLIETWLAAHFYRLRDQAVASEKAGSVGVSYQYEVGLIFAQTKEGQTAMALDTDGNLARLSKDTELGKTRRQSVVWLGTGCEEE